MLVLTLVHTVSDRKSEIEEALEVGRQAGSQVNGRGLCRSMQQTGNGDGGGVTVTTHRATRI